MLANVYPTHSWDHSNRKPPSALSIAFTQERATESSLFARGEGTLHVIQGDQNAF